MKEIDNISKEKEQYDDVIVFVSELTSQRYCCLNLSDDIANAIFLKLMKRSAFSETLKVSTNFIKSVIPKSLEYLFNYYQKLSFQFCFSKTQDPNLFEDIAHEVIIHLLSSKSKINNAYGWIRQVTHILPCEHYKRLKDERKLYRDLMNEASLIKQIMINNIEELNFTNPEQMIPKTVINGGNYISYLRLEQFDNLTDYAKVSNISYEAAKDESKKINRNLKSEILLALGWQASPDILDFKQYKSIQSFIRKLLVNMCDTGKGLDELRRLHPELPKALDGYKSVEDLCVLFVKNPYPLKVMQLSALYAKY